MLKKIHFCQTKAFMYFNYKKNILNVKKLLMKQFDHHTYNRMLKGYNAILIKIKFK